MRFTDCRRMPFLIACSSCCFDLSRYIDAMFSYDFSISDNSSSSDRLVGTPLSTDVL